MSSNIISGGDKLSRTQHIKSLTPKKSELIHITIEDEKKSISIKQIQDIYPKIAIEPIYPRIIWIEEANLLTLPAQNALLKILEEGSSNTSFYLTCNSIFSLLPTIRSRCTHQVLQNINNTTRNEISSEDELPKLKSIMAMSPGDRIMAIEKRDRTQSVAWIAQIEQELREKLHDPTLSKQALLTITKIAKNAQNTTLALQANCSVSLCTMNFYLLLPHTRTTP